MKAKRLYLSLREKRKLKKWRGRTRNAGTRCRAQVVLLYDEGRTTPQIAAAVGYDPSGVRKIRQRFEDEGLASVRDRRRDPRPWIIDDDRLEALRQFLTASPQAVGRRRPTWTRELMADALAERTGVRPSLSTITRMLKRLGARLGRPKPIVLCPWSRRRKDRRLRELRQLTEHPPAGEVVVYADEIDIHLNPHIGRDWMLPGTQRRVVTPGQNQKRYVAGALDARSGRLHWVTHDRKTTDLFAMLLGEVYRAYPRARRIHFILDNYVIHKTAQVERVLARQARGKIVLHFLPPYCPDHNRIERFWQDLHANVTRNHQCATIEELMDEVTAYLRNPAGWSDPTVHTQLKAAA